ncbi:MAG: ParB/RepB/Spo0J family partition protein [Pseudomonadota bacterium]
MPRSPLTVDPATCRVWTGQPRRLSLTPETCADLIDSIRAQGGQEIPAIVRPLRPRDTHTYEIICGARRHFAVTHLRAEGLEIGFLIAPREIGDEEAFRLADLENRARRDITPYDRAVSYAAALDQYYGGVQKDMAEKMQVRPPYLARYLQIARLPAPLVAAFADPADIRENHARRIARLLADPAQRLKLEHEAHLIVQARADGAQISAAEVLSRLERVLPGQPPKKAPHSKTYRRSIHDRPITVTHRGDETTVSFPTNLTQRALRGALERFFDSTYPNGR